MPEHSKNADILLTVALPMYRSGNIAWLALESLCRQKDISFPWELIVAEECDDALGEESLRNYTAPLEAVGCRRIEYIPVSEWIPLSLKWLRIAHAASSSSRYFLLHAADCFSQPYRLSNTVQLFEKHQADWVQAAQGPFYHIATRTVTVFDYSLVPDYAHSIKGWRKHPTALNMAARTEHISALPTEEVQRGVDGWIFFGIQDLLGRQLVIAWDESKYWKDGADTHGLNRISHGRGKLIQDVSPPFRPYESPEHPVLPRDILDRLEETRTAAIENELNLAEAYIEELLQQLSQKDDKLENFRGMIQRRNEKISKLESKTEELRKGRGKRPRK